MSKFLGLPGAYQVSTSMHADNRKRVLAKLGASGGILLFKGGEATSAYDTDREELFRQESNFQYLFGVKEPDCWAIIDVKTGHSTLLVPRLDPSYATWMGKIQPPAFFQDMYDVEASAYTDELAATVAALSPEQIYIFMGTNTDSGNKPERPSFEGMDAYKVNDSDLFVALCETRVIKSEAELDLMRHINAASSEAHVHVLQNCKPGMVEYQLESMFLFYCYRNYGCRNMSYVCIVGSGDNASILHYGHAAAPNSRVLGEHDIMLLDMGANYHGYCSDITCSYPSNGIFTPDQAMIFNCVRHAQNAVIAEMGPGVMWPDMHMLAERAILKGLVEGGVLKGDVEEMMKVYLGAVFMPHGLGHFLGLDTHDVGGYPAGVVRATRPGLQKLRCGRQLQTGMVLTVEPGCYFIDHLLDAALADPAQSVFIVADRLAQFRGFGGVRLEDCVIVKGDKGGENMTKCPRTVEDVEYVMGGGKWPRE